MRKNTRALSSSLVLVAFSLALVAAGCGQAQRSVTRTQTVTGDGLPPAGLEAPPRRR